MPDIRIGHLNIVDHLILGIALPGKENPVHPDLSSDISVFSMNSIDQLAHGLKSDEINLAFMDIPLAMDLFDAGLDIALLMFAHRAGSRMIGNPGMRKMSDFKEKSILIPHPLSVQHMLLHQFMDAKGMIVDTKACPGSIRAENVPSGVMAEMMAQDQDNDIAAFICPDPFGARAIDQGIGKPLFTSGDLWKNHPGCGVVVNNSLLTTHAGDVEFLIRLFFESALTLERRSDLEEKNIKHAGDFLKQPPEKIKETITASGVSYTPDLLIPDPGLLEIVLQYMSSTMGLLSPAIELDTFIKPAFAQKAVSELNL